LVIANIRYVEDRTGNTLARPSLKQQRGIAGEWFLCATDSWVHARWHEILGPVTAWHKPGGWCRLDPRRAQCATPTPAQALELHRKVVETRDDHARCLPDYQVPEFPDIGELLYLIAPRS
jgi:hypothetical protein